MELYLVTFLFLFLAHDFKYDLIVPWPLPDPRRILMNYIIGTVGMLAPFAWKLYELGETDLLWSLCGFVVAAGLAPMLAYARDALQNIYQERQEQMERAVALKEQRDEQTKRNG